MGRELLAMPLAGDAPSGILAAGKWELKKVLPSLDSLIPWVHSDRTPLAPGEDSAGSRYWSRLLVLGHTLWFNTETQRPWHLIFSKILMLGEKWLSV